MNSHSILEGDHPQVAAAQFGDRRPESIPICLLHLGSNRVLDDISAPFLLQVGPLSKNLVLEIPGELEFRPLTPPEARDYRALPRREQSIVR